MSSELGRIKVDATVEYHSDVEPDLTLYSGPEYSRQESSFRMSAQNRVIGLGLGKHGTGSLVGHNADLLRE